MNLPIQNKQIHANSPWKMQICTYSVSKTVCVYPRATWSETENTGRLNTSLQLMAVPLVCTLAVNREETWTSETIQCFKTCDYSKAKILYINCDMDNFTDKSFTTGSIPEHTQQIQVRKKWCNGCLAGLATRQRKT